MRKNIRLKILVTVLLCGIVCLGRPAATLAQSGNPSTNRTATQGIGKLTGKVVDATTLAPVEFATVSLFTRRDSALVTGTVTNPQGEFVLENLPVGSFRIKISFIGYRTATKDSFQITAQDPIKTLGTIKLRTSSQTLQEVVVTGQKEIFQQSIDKRVFNVDQSIVTQGGSASDVLENIPSLAVDTDGGITMRGSGEIIVLIDGKPSTLTGSSRQAILEQLPASAIESVEVITNPSSKYDAEGMAGIINIILKKNKLEGFNGMATVSVGTRDKYNASANINYRTGKFNLFSNYSYRYSSRFTRGYTDRFTLTEADTLTLLQNQNGMDRDNTHLIRAGLEYFLNSYNTLGISATYNNDREAEDQSVRNLTLNGDGSFNRQFYRFTEGSERGENYDLNATYRRTFEKKGQELTASMVYSSNSDNDASAYRSQSYNPDNTPSDENPTRQFNPNIGRNTVTTIQADYTQPFKGDAKLETGYKSIIRKTDNDYIFQEYNDLTNQYETDPLVSNRFVYHEQVHALYANYGATIKHFGYQTGLRVEQTLTRSEQKTTNQTYTYDYLGLFPSVFLSYKLPKEQQLQLNYTRRINRPGTRQLNPFVDLSDPTNISFGNPQLRPEYANAYELNYLKGWKNVFLTSSAYFRRSTNEFQRYVSVDSNNISTTSFINLGYEDSYGLELIARTTITKWWNVTTTLNFFRRAINGQNEEINLTNANTTWSGQLMSTMNIPKIIQLQINANYRGPTAEAQGTRYAMYGVNVGIKRDVMKGNGSLSLNVTDIFNTRQMRMKTSGDGFVQAMTRKRESRIATLTFSYKFGKFTDPDKRRSRRAGGDDDSDDQNSGEDSF